MTYFDMPDGTFGWYSEDQHCWMIFLGDSVGGWDGFNTYFVSSFYWQDTSMGGNGFYAGIDSNGNPFCGWL